MQDAVQLALGLFLVYVHMVGALSLASPVAFAAGVATGSSKAWIGGGYTGSNVLNTINILDFVDASSAVNTSSVALEIAAEKFAAAFLPASGEVVFGFGWNRAGTAYNQIQIFSASDGTSVDARQFSLPRFAIAGAGIVSYGLFAGGMLPNGSNCEVVDVIDRSGFNTSFSSLSLSVPRAYLVSAVLGSQVFFAGGQTTGGIPTSAVDIFDSRTGVFIQPPSQLSVPRYFLSFCCLSSIDEPCHVCWWIERNTSCCNN